MSVLPDLDTDSVGYIAYWNIIDDGGAVSSFTISDVLNYDGIVSSTAYDNGFTGEIELTENESSKTGYFRVKSDGWFSVYIDRGISIATDESNVNNIEGPFDFSKWNDTRNPEKPDSITNCLSEEINNLQSEVPEATTFSHSDVGLYNYITDATAVTLLSDKSDGLTGSGPWDFSYTESTNILSCYATHAWEPSDNRSISSSFEGVSLIDSGGSNRSTSYYGVIDCLSNNLVSDSGVGYGHSIPEDFTGSPDYYSSISVIINWE